MFEPKKEGRISRHLSRFLLLTLFSACLCLFVALFTTPMCAFPAILLLAIFFVWAFSLHRCPHCGDPLLGAWWFYVFLLPLTRWWRHLHWLENESGLVLHLRWNKADAGYCHHCDYHLLYDDQP